MAGSTLFQCCGSREAHSNGAATFYFTSNQIKCPNALCFKSNMKPKTIMCRKMCTGTRGTVKKFTSRTGECNHFRDACLKNERSKRSSTAALVLARKSNVNVGVECCTVCMDLPRTHAMVPCGHRCVCHTCASKLEHCPLCRVITNSNMRVFD